MNKAVAVTILIAGGFALWGAIHVWHGKKGGQRQDQSGWKQAVIVLVVLAGLGIGGGLSGLFGLSFLYTKLGFVPLWLVLAAGTGVWFIVDLLIRHAWSRTPLLGFLTAALIAIPVAPPALGAMTHGHQVPQVTSYRRHGG